MASERPMSDRLMAGAKVGVASRRRRIECYRAACSTTQSGGLPQCSGDDEGLEIVSQLWLGREQGRRQQKHGTGSTREQQQSAEQHCAGMRQRAAAKVDQGQRQLLVRQDGERGCGKGERTRCQATTRRRGRRGSRVAEVSSCSQPQSQAKQLGHDAEQAE
ncbi:hypothetical protein K402DRAFT_139860 [Aulographum hederae CBS 113979]|uniref:Uncharacterized protein n=1 Tax=Aulographum hederae CBS 113979 TaxID=1176131 RepID=A0A6G1GUF3_9PEZI|nr:hypothetical protein K402DRAFT_139860 [Aulographum hederae CBS 113979]